MMTPFDVWAPMFRAPFSGDVTQEIVPRILSPDIAGSAEIEARIQTDVASYGTQLGKVLEALQTLAAATKTDLPAIDKLVAQIEGVKDQNRDTIRADAERALARLKAVDKESWRSLTRGD
ncbi:hypothetical protein GCM10007385_22800 [Tateyamaria omphalii]|uniref:hypothetical protein n=1 Tax=Tateyamaria omphalii TaxID=299262 RepID=UPI0016787B6F|nr:hypothetical protein [Tateyamaria omphalii]GGX54045.1 hypothetical protein GCM10007385_22800 [Tateyamaria omphalii]